MKGGLRKLEYIHKIQLTSLILFALITYPIIFLTIDHPPTFLIAPLYIILLSTRIFVWTLTYYYVFKKKIAVELNKLIKSFKVFLITVLIEATIYTIIIYLAFITPELIFYLVFGILIASLPNFLSDLIEFLKYLKGV